MKSHQVSNKEVVAGGDKRRSQTSRISTKKRVGQTDAGGERVRGRSSSITGQSSTFSRTALGIAVTDSTFITDPVHAHARAPTQAQPDRFQHESALLFIHSEYLKCGYISQH